MRFIYSEGSNNYLNYLFPYQVLLLKEESDLINNIYEKGFLPVRSIKNLFYLARSCRVNLEKFRLSSENRRILRKNQNVKLEIIPLAKFDVNKRENREIIDIFTKRKFLSKQFTHYGIRRIFLDNGNYNFVIGFVKDNKKIGLVAICLDESIIHYAHPFYRENRLGMLMMTRIVDWAKNNQKKYVYLGTCYGKNSLYKVQFEGFEFFDGISWSGDLEKLKYLVENDSQAKSSHLFQDSTYLKKFYAEDKLGRLIKKLQNEKS